MSTKRLSMRKIREILRLCWEMRLSTRIAAHEALRGVGRGVHPGEAVQFQAHLVLGHPPRHVEPLDPDASWYVGVQLVDGAQPHLLEHLAGLADVGKNVAHLAHPQTVNSVYAEPGGGRAGGYLGMFDISFAPMGIDSQDRKAEQIRP